MCLSIVGIYWQDINLENQKSNVLKRSGSSKGPLRLRTSWTAWKTYKVRQLCQHFEPVLRCWVFCFLTYILLWDCHHHLPVQEMWRSWLYNPLQQNDHDVWKVYVNSYGSPSPEERLTSHGGSFNDMNKIIKTWKFWSVSPQILKPECITATVTIIML